MARWRGGGRGGWGWGRRRSSWSWAENSSSGGGGRKKNSWGIGPKKTKKRSAAASYYDYSFRSLEEDLNILLPTQAFHDHDVIDVGAHETVGQDDVGTDELDFEVQLCSLKGDIVGIRYYKGIVSNNEMVSLIREPHNQYDPNAVKVCNVAGEQVGHIKRELARPLAFILDNKLARVEGVVPFGCNNTYQMTVHLSLWGRREKKSQTIAKLRQCGFYPTESPTVEMPETVAGPSSGASAYSPCRTALTAAEMTNQLDTLFEKLEEGDKTTEKEATNAICTPLFQHQKQALNWMVRRECGLDLPPFWRETGQKGMYFNSITCFTTLRRPDSVKGGILADDMGLGKTLEVIALILTNFQDGEPLAVPVPGKVRPSKLVRDMRMTMYRSHYKHWDQSSGKSQRPRARKILSLKRGRRKREDSDSETMCVSDDQLSFVNDEVEQLPDGEDEEAEFSGDETESDTESVDLATMLDKDDPNFSPIKLKKSKTRRPAASCSRPRRSSKKPVKYSYSSDEGATDDTASVKSAQNAKSRGKPDQLITIPKTPAASSTSINQPITGADLKAALAITPPDSGKPASSAAPATLPSSFPDTTTTILGGQKPLNVVPALVYIYPDGTTKVVTNPAAAVPAPMPVLAITYPGSGSAPENLTTPAPSEKTTAPAHATTSPEQSIAVPDDSKGRETEENAKPVAESPVVESADLGVSEEKVEEAAPPCLEVVPVIKEQAVASKKRGRKGRLQKTQSEPAPVALGRGRPRRNVRKPARYANSSDEECNTPEACESPCKRARITPPVEPEPAPLPKGRGKGKGKKSPLTVTEPSKEPAVALALPPSEPLALPPSAPLALPPSAPLALPPSAPLALPPSEPSALPPSEHLALPPSVPLALPPSEQVAPPPAKPDESLAVVAVAAAKPLPDSQPSTEPAVAGSTNLALPLTWTPGAEPPSKPDVQDNIAPALPLTGAVVPSPAKKLVFTKNLSPGKHKNKKKGGTATLLKSSSISLISDDDGSLPDLPDPTDEITISDNSTNSGSSKSIRPNGKRRLPKSGSSQAPILVLDPEDELPDLPTLPGDEDSSDLPELKVPPPPVPGASKCGKTSGRTKGKGPRTTLIVCPLSVMSNWLDQFEEHVDENVHLEIYTYYGTTRTRDTNLLARQDVVLTTYQTLASDAKGCCSLQKVKWLRIVLDEAHTIRNSNAMQTKAVLSLEAERKWALTGTPIQNSIKDLYSLVNFMQIAPFTDKIWWHRTIERPIGRGDQSALKRVSQLMRSVAMRRMKTQMVNGKPLVDLPPKTIFLEQVKLSEEERKTYDIMQKEGKLIVSRYFRQGTLLHHYGEVLAILMRLRQLCCHPFLIAKAAQAVADTLDNVEAATGIRATPDELRSALVEKIIMVLTSGSEEECAICLEPLRIPAITHCAHVFCRACIDQVINTEQPDAHCPLCRAEVRTDHLVEVPPEMIEAAEAESTDTVTNKDWQSSTKVDALMAALINLRTEDPTVKSLVVSQFTSFLTVIETPLRHNGFKFVRLDGTMTAKQRVSSIEAFSDPNPEAPTIFLLSLKAGGVGLNLTAASRVFLMEPAWNPASEEQCFDRCHRLGQKREVIVTKFIVEESVEERMLELQEKKRQLMQGAFGAQKKQTAEERRRARINDIKNLMQI